MSSSLAPECHEVKEYAVDLLAAANNSNESHRRYDSCFLKWYSESTNFQPPMCESLLIDKSTYVVTLRQTTVPTCSKITKSA